MKRYFIASNVVLLTILSYLIVKSGYQMVVDHLTAAPISQNIAASVASSETETRYPLTHYAVITDRNLFNTKTEAELKAPPPTTPIAPPKQTDLKLKLWGTVSGEAIKPQAVIEDLKTREQTLYKEGDTVQSALVKQILREKVILSVNGKDEILQMDSEEKGAGLGKSGGNFPQPVGAASVETPQTPTPAPEPSSSSSPAVSSAADSEPTSITMPRAKIEDAVNNVNNLMRQARIRPHFENGQPDGLTITNIQPDSIFSQLGLRSGDILTGIDGKEIKSVDDALKFYQNLKSASNVSIQIKRRGEQKTIDYHVE